MHSAQAVRSAPARRTSELREIAGNAVQNSMRRRRGAELRKWANQLFTPKRTDGGFASRSIVCLGDASRLARTTYDESSSYNESVIALKALIAGVRKHGTYKRYMRAPHREVLVVRGLAQRGKLRTDHSALAFLAKQGDNGVVWHILSYWRPDN